MWIIVKNRVKVLFWRIFYHGIINSKKHIKKCAYCKNKFIISDDSIKYRHWNISGYYETYWLCSTGVDSCYAHFRAEYVDAPIKSEDLVIYVVSE